MLPVIHSTGDVQWANEYGYTELREEKYLSVINFCQCLMVFKIIILNAITQGNEYRPRRQGTRDSDQALQWLGVGEKKKGH